MSTSEQNLKYLKDIDNYTKLHTDDYKQVFFNPASVNATIVQNAQVIAKPIKTISGNHNVQSCTANAAQEGGEYFSLEPNVKDPRITQCAIYSASQIKQTDKKMPAIVKSVWTIVVPGSTSYVCLDMIGNLNAYDSKHQLLATIMKSQDPADKRSKADKFKLVLFDNKDSYLQPLRIQNERTGASYSSITVQPMELTRNPDWEPEHNIMRTMTNKEQQVQNKRVAEDRITSTVGLISNDYRYKLALNLTESGEKQLVLLAAIKDNRQVYKMNTDEKVGKLYYAGTYPEHKFLKEVPGSMQTVQPGNYSTYQDVYPNMQANYEIKDAGNNKCSKVCDDDAGCNAVYTVVDSVSKKTQCFVSKNAPTYNAKPVNGKMDSSFLQVKNPAIQSNNASYIADAYKTDFASYKPDGVIGSDFVFGPEGAPYVQDLKQKVVGSTWSNNNTTVADNTDDVKKERFTADDALNKLSNVNLTANKYISHQTDLSNNKLIIEQKLTNINRVYTDMSNNNIRDRVNLYNYDFTTKDANGKPISVVIGKEDNSLDKAIENDNAVYQNEHQNLYTVASLTMATLLVMAIII